MPIYQYRCPTCGKIKEVLQASTEPTEQICEGCGSRAERIISPVGIIFKGKGFHVTDYGKNGRKGRTETVKKEKESAPSEKKTESGKEAKSENKPEPAKKEGKK